MNCRQCQEKIVESLAAGATPHPPDVSVHRQVCPACCEFYEQQVSLFRSMEAGLQLMLNQEVPPSLVPSLRARLDQLPPAHRAWIPSWSLAVTVAAAAVLALSLGYSLYRQGSHLNSPDNGAIVSPNVVVRESGVEAPPESAAALPSRPRTRASAVVSSPATSEVAPKVVIPAEERQAFATLVNELPKRRDVALALTQPALAAPDVSVDIALLQIEQMEVKPLEGTPAE
jgi:hypothetical protein